MDDKAKALLWADYMSPACGKYRFATAAQDKWKQAGREAYTMEHARRELADKGLLPRSCVVSWKNCGRYLDTTRSACNTERENFLIEVQQYMASGVAMPQPVPTPTVDGWAYPPAWGKFRSAPGSTERPSVGGGSEERLDTSITNVPETSTRTVAIGLGIGVGLLVLGLWLSSRK
jgi:hypothetical protein